MNALKLQKTQTPRTRRTASGDRPRPCVPADRSGQVIAGRWRLERALGVGGAGSVYAAEHQNGKRVAIKVLHPELIDDSDVKSRFLMEPRVTNRICHPGVISIHDDGVTEDGAPFFVMDLLEGETIEQQVEQNGAFELGKAISLTAQLLDILVAVHARGINHLDIKPSNIFVSAGARVHLLDFGVARLAREPNSNQAGVALGTPMFMAPEQAKADWALVDHRSDLWAAGAVLRYVLTAEYMRSGSNVAEVMTEARTRAVPSARELGLCAHVATFIDRALAFLPSQRFASASAMREELRVLCERLNLGSSIPEVSGSSSGRASLRAAAQTPGVAGPDSTPASLSAVVDFRTPRSGTRVWAVAVLVPAVIGLAGFGRSFVADTSEVPHTNAASSVALPIPMPPPRLAAPTGLEPVPSPPVANMRPTLPDTDSGRQLVNNAVRRQQAVAGARRVSLGQPRQSSSVRGPPEQREPEASQLERRLPGAGLEPDTEVVADSALNAPPLVAEDPLASRY